MIEYLIGTIADITENFVIIESGGIGYGITVSATTLSHIKNGEKAKIYTYLSIKEDGVSLFGFYSKQEKDIFLHLIAVSGIGPKMAISILSGINVDEFIAVVASGDHMRLCSIKGVGKKTAERIVLELKDKLKKDYSKNVDVEFVPFSSYAEEAILALMSMGFSRQEATLAVSKVQCGSEMSTEQIVLAALKGAK